MPSAPDVAITPAPKRLGKPCATIAGRMIAPIATTVAGDEPEIAANSAQAITPARPRPPYQWPIIVVANAIMRRATPPWVRKLPGQDEERDRHDLEVLDPGEKLQRHRLDRHLCHGEQEGQHGEAERDRHRHAGQHQHDQQAEDEGGGHRAAPCDGGDASAGCRAGASTSMPSTRVSSWCGKWPVFQNAHATCRKRKHIR